MDIILYILIAVLAALTVWAIGSAIYISCTGGE